MSGETDPGEALFGAREVAPGLVLGERPPVEIERRDERAALAAILAAARSSGTTPEAAGGGDAGPWYHTIELPSGVVTDGVYDHRPLVPYYGLPGDLTGRRALDVGTADGFWAFELERRGADVTAVDVERLSDLDLPPALSAGIAGSGDDSVLDFHFAEAHRRIGSRVRLIRRSVFELDPAELGAFDVVHCGDLLVHLERPLAALRRLRAVTAGDALIADVVSLHPGALVEYRGGWENVSWWLPSVTALAQMVHDAGFGEVEVRAVYRLDMRDGPGPWRALIAARP
jgi:tRNA (mo5U34)-methyltransferase